MQETPVPDSCSLRLLVIAGEIIASRTLAIFFFGSLTLLKVIVSILFSQPALNLKQKAEKTLISFRRAAQLPRPANHLGCRESLLVNLEFWIIASPLMHKSSGSNQFHLRFAHVTLQFRNIGGDAKEHP